MTDHIEPLSPALWFQRIEKVANGELANIENALRHASHLLQITPEPFRHVVRLAIHENRFEALLEAGDFDSAARHLVAQPTALTVEEDHDEPRVKATISCAILNRTIVGTGETVASAILSAWTTCLLALGTEFGSDRVSVLRPLEHTRRSERDRRLH